MFAGAIIVVWEGMEGAGKTTLMKRVGEMLSSKGYRVAYYKTPSGTAMGRFAAEFGNKPGTDPLTRMLLFLANTSSDSKIMREKILEERPRYFFIDRYYLCSITYGLAYARLQEADITPEDFINLLKIIEKTGSKVLLRPDLHVIVDVEESVRMRRLERQGGGGRLDEELERSAMMQDYVRKFYQVFHEWRRENSLWVENPEGRLNETAEKVAERILQLKVG